MSEDLKSMVESALALSQEELKSSLPFLMDAIKGFGAKEMIKTIPDFIPRMMQKIELLDLPKFVREAPEGTAKFLDVLWEGARFMAQEDPELTEKLKEIGFVRVNFEATDSPMKGHFKIEGGKLSGGGKPVMLADLTIEAPTDTLVGLLTGRVDPVWGALKGEYKVKGKVSTAMKLAPLMKRLPRIFRG